MISAALFAGIFIAAKFSGGHVKTPHYMISLTLLSAFPSTAQARLVCSH